jgi:hypothetical protein
MPKIQSKNKGKATRSARITQEDLQQQLRKGKSMEKDKQIADSRGAEFPEQIGQAHDEPQPDRDRALEGEVVDADVPGASPIMKHFRFDHLARNLMEISRPICELAKQYDERLPACAEKTAGLRKLLEAKDCFVRAENER